MEDKLQKQIEFIIEVDKLKKICRQSIITDSSRAENDAEHSWHLALMAIVLKEYANENDLDLLKVIKMVVIHDIVEIDAGDTYIFDVEGYKDKSEREIKAAERIYSILPDEQGKELKSLCEEFEARETNEAKFAASLDRLEPLILNSKTKGHTWKKHNISSDKVKEKNVHVQEGSKQLWSLTNELIEDCILKGYLTR